MAELRAEFDDPIKAKQARVAVEALGAPSLSIGTSSQSSGASSATTVSVGDGKQGGFLNAVMGLFGGGKASVGASKQFNVGPSKSVSKEWSFGSQAPTDDGVVHQSFSGDHKTVMTVRIGDDHAAAARAALTGAGAVSVS